MSTSKVLRASEQGCRKSAGHPMCPENGLYFPVIFAEFVCHLLSLSAIFCHISRKFSPSSEKGVWQTKSAWHSLCSHTSEIGQVYYF